MSNEQIDKSLQPETTEFTTELFNKVVSAVRCSFNSSTSNIEKQNALKYLEDLKENHPILCSTISFELLKQPNDQPILYHYSLHLIESIIKNKWNILKTDEKNLIKRQLFFLIKNCYLNQTFIDPIYMKNSLSKCVVEMIKRDCFDKIDTTFDEIVNMTQSIIEIQENNFIQLELILLVYRFLNEELTIYAQTIQAQRRRQILNQIQKRLNDILPCLIRISNVLLNAREQQERLTQTCLLTVNSFLSWVDYNYFESCELFLYELFLKFFQLNSVKLRHASFECLLSLVNKRLARRQLQQQQQQKNKRVASLPSAALNCDQERIFLNYLLGGETLEMFFRLLISPTDSIEQLRTIVTNDHINCLKLLGQFLIKLSNYLLQLFQQLATKSIDNNDFLTFVNERTNSFLQYLLLLNQHPFHLLSLNSYQALNLFLIRQPTLLSNQQFCLKLIFNLKQSLNRIYFSSSTISTNMNDNELFRKHYSLNQQCFIYVLFEYDSEEQFFWKFFSQYRSELQKLIKSFIGLYFIEPITDRSIVTEMNIICLKSLLENLFIYLESLIQRTPNKIGHEALTDLPSIYIIIEWEAFYLLFDHVLFVIRKELFSSSTITNDYQKTVQSLLMTSTMTEQFIRILKFLLQFTPNLSEHIHGHVLNLLSCLFFITQHDQTLSIQIIQRILTTFQSYQQQIIDGKNLNECEIMQIQSSNAFLYICKNYTTKIIDYYSELFPFLCQLYKNEFEIKKNILSITVDELSSPTLKLLDAAQILIYHKLIHSSNIDNKQYEDFYSLVKPIYDMLNISLSADCLKTFIEYIDLCSNRQIDSDIINYRRRNLKLALHCLCLILRYSKQQQIDANIHSKIYVSLRTLLYDHILKITIFCNQLYDQQMNPFYNILKTYLIYSETEKQLYLGTYESNNMAKATISTTITPSSLPVSCMRLQTIGDRNIDDQRLRDYLHRLFDICYQINGMYFAHDTDLYFIKLNDDNYFLTTYLQKILFENLNTLPSFRLRIVLRHFCRSFVETYCSLHTIDRDNINELFLTFFDAFIPYIQQRLKTMWNISLSTTIINNQKNECSDEVIEECICVLITRDFVDIIRYFLFKTIPGQTNSNKKKTKIFTGRQNSESMCEETNADFDQIDEWDENISNTTTTTTTNNNNNISSRLSNSFPEKLDYSDSFMYMVKMSRQNSTLSLRLFSSIIHIICECLTFPDAYCANRFLPIIYPITKLYTDIFDKNLNTNLLVDRKFLFQCLIKALETHNENEGLNTNIVSLIGHIYELWYTRYGPELDLVFQQMVPQLNFDVLNTYKTRLTNQTINNKKQQQITERERRDTMKNLLSSILLSPVSSNKRDEVNSTNLFHI